MVVPTTTTPIDQEPVTKRVKAEAEAPANPENKKILCKKLNPRATLPTKGSKSAAGFDLYASINPTEEGNEETAFMVIPPHGKALVKTDIAVKFGQEGLYGRVAPRSGLAWKQHVGVGAGVIDADYRGNVGVVLFNHSGTESVTIRHGDRIAQLILEKYECSVEECEEVDELDETERGAGGFGSTGTR